MLPPISRERTRLHRTGWLAITTDQFIGMICLIAFVFAVIGIRELHDRRRWKQGPPGHFWRDPAEPTKAEQVIEALGQAASISHAAGALLTSPEAQDRARAAALTAAALARRRGKD